jgi:hypothetical protein
MPEGEPSTLVTEIWRVRVGDDDVTAQLWTHPLGPELRLYWNSTLQQSQVHRHEADAETHSQEMRLSLTGYSVERSTLAGVKQLASAEPSGCGSWRGNPPVCAHHPGGWLRSSRYRYP